MNEMDLIKVLGQQEIDDVSDFDNYAMQFVSSLVDLGDPDPGSDYWHGRLIGYDSPESGSLTETTVVAPSPYEINFFGEIYNERDFRKLLMSKRLHIKSFKLISAPDYQEESLTPSRGLDTHTVKYEAEIHIDGEKYPRRVTVTHHIRKTYLSYHTEIS